MNDSQKLEAQRKHLIKQFDVKSAIVTTHKKQRCVKAKISNKLSNGKNYTRIVYYNAAGNIIH